MENMWHLMAQALEVSLDPGATNILEADESESRRARARLALVGSTAAKNAYRSWQEALHGFWDVAIVAKNAKVEAERLVKSGAPQPQVDRAWTNYDAAMNGLDQPMADLDRAAKQLEKTLRGESS
jgi:hypothetical protein